MNNVAKFIHDSIAAIKAGAFNVYFNLIVWAIDMEMIFLMRTYNFKVTQLPVCDMWQLARFL